MCLVRARLTLTLGLTGLLLVGCSGPLVKTIGNGGGPPVYALQGSSAGEIEAEAKRLCGEPGYVVLRAGQNTNLPPAGDNAGARWMVAAGQWLGGMPGNVAQATVLCRG